MRLLGLKTFRHGVHPPELKDETSGLAIRRLPFAPLLAVPLLQHAGAAALPVVREGDDVVRGQCIARPDGRMSVAMHAPVTGRVKRIAMMPGISGRMVPAVWIEPHPASTQEEIDGTSRRPASWDSVAPPSRRT
jgi:electron transport complex protein RnfC